MRLTHLGSSSPISVHFIFIHAQSSSSVRSHLGSQGLCLSSFAGGCLGSQVVVFVHGRGSCPGCLSFVRGGRRRPLQSPTADRLLVT